MDAIDKQIQELAQKALDSKNANWVGHAIVFLVVWFGVLLLRYKLAKSNKELAEARTALELEKLRAERAKFEAQLHELEEQAATARAMAEAAAAAAAQEEERLCQAEARYKEQLEKIDKLSKWEELDRLAGVTP